MPPVSGVYDVVGGGANPNKSRDDAGDLEGDFVALIDAGEPKKRFRRLFGL
jgi:hypothetical protein